MFPLKNQIYFTFVPIRVHIGDQIWNHLVIYSPNNSLHEMIVEYWRRVEIPQNFIQKTFVPELMVHPVVVE